MAYKSLLERFADYLHTCPLVQPEAPFCVDYLGKEDKSYSVTSTPYKTVRTDVIGNETITATFQFSLRALVTDEASRAENSRFLDGFAEWLREQNDSRNFPVMLANEEAKAIIVSDFGILEEADESRTTGIYVAEIKFTYKRRKKQWPF